MATDSGIEQPIKSATPGIGAGLVLLALVIVAVAAWVLLGGLVFGVHSLYAGFLFLWYWTSVEKAEFNRVLPAVAGALVGIGLSWQLQYLAVNFAVAGLVIGLLVICVAILVQIMNWLPFAVNPCAMLFLTVLTGPVLLKTSYFPEVGKAAVLGAALFSAIVYAAKRAAGYWAARP